MKELNMTKQFTVEDIRKLREYNALRHQGMTAKDIISERQKTVKEFLEKVMLSGEKFGIA